jgi:Zn finger protein HypA/HybF involved in hydrogenase expression
VLVGGVNAASRAAETVRVRVSRLTAQSLWCRLMAHRYDGFAWDSTCERCGVERYDLGACPACDHENSVRVWVAGVTCENCGYAD